MAPAVGGKGPLAGDRGRGSHSWLPLAGPPEVGATRLGPPASPGSDLQAQSAVPSLHWGHEWAPDALGLARPGTKTGRGQRGGPHGPPQAGTVPPTLGPQLAQMAPGCAVLSACPFPPTGRTEAGTPQPGPRSSRRARSPAAGPKVGAGGGRSEAAAHRGARSRATRRAPQIPPPPGAAGLTGSGSPFRAQGRCPGTSGAETVNPDWPRVSWPVDSPSRAPCCWLLHAPGLREEEVCCASIGGRTWLRARRWPQGRAWWGRAYPQSSLPAGRWAWAPTWKLGKGPLAQGHSLRSVGPVLLGHPPRAQGVAGAEGWVQVGLAKGPGA